VVGPGNRARPVVADDPGPGGHEHLALHLHEGPLPARPPHVIGLQIAHATT
jgi:hypothetical protein